MFLTQTWNKQIHLKTTGGCCHLFRENTDWKIEYEPINNTLTLTVVAGFSGCHWAAAIYRCLSPACSHHVLWDDKWPESREIQPMNHLVNDRTTQIAHGYMWCCARSMISPFIACTAALSDKCKLRLQLSQAPFVLLLQRSPQTLVFALPWALLRLPWLLSDVLRAVLAVSWCS